MLVILHFLKVAQDEEQTERVKIQTGMQKLGRV